MRRLWDVVSFMAVVNLLAIVAFVGWLGATDRLSSDRIARLRELFAPTVAAEAEAAAQTQAAEDDLARAAEDEARRLDPPLPSAAQIRQMARTDDGSAQTLRRLRDEAAQHQAALDLRSAQLDERERALETREAAWRDEFSDDVEAAAEAQFRKTVGIYEALAGKQAKRLLLELVEQGAIDQAVAYLDAMEPRAVAKTIREMKSDTESELAARLLERIRTLGLDAEGAELTGNDDLASAPD